jgi:ATP-dependent Lhr-like helicase
VYDDDGAVLSSFLSPVSRWFRETLGVPTPAQRDGWPSISSGRNTLIFAPTGSGKTLAAFLAALDFLWRNPRQGRGVRILYVSPLKALNQDVARNLRQPLDGIIAYAERLGVPLPALSVAVRTGDSTPAERQKLARRPPDILITTPESLHLMLTSRARETLRGVSHVIVDEIHALAPNKRGVFLALLLERLERLNPSSFVRVGLSATQRPLEEVARYLGGRNTDGPRPVTIIDAGRRRDIDLLLSLPARSPVTPSAESIWPSIEAKLAEWIALHRSTIVFANNRRVAERLTARLNASDTTDNDVAHAHHGSLSPERRRVTEEALKAGELAAVVATASLELGIDMGAVDRVCQGE